MSVWYFFYQKVPESDWTLALADHRERIVKDIRPPFTTILDVDKNFEGEITADYLAEAYYRGPFYIDLDSNDVEEVTEQFQKLLRKLEKEYNVNLEQLTLYATGGRGYHIIFNPLLFMTKNPPRGLHALPLIYKEMANELFVDTLDLNIYSTKRGRQFREKNVERTNGRFKVQITVEEALAMTPEQYVKITSEKRYLPATPPPDFSADMGLLFAKSSDKVMSAIKSRKNRKADDSLLKSFGGKIPPSVLSVMSGKNLSENVSFNTIATQLAITAHALLQNEKDFLSSCQGLIDTDLNYSERYGTPAKRQRELSRMYAYMAENPCYTFSIGGIKSVMTKEVQAPDLDMGSVAPSDEADDTETQFSVSQGIRVTAGGIFRKTDEGLVRVSAMGLSNPRQLVDINTQEVQGYSVDVSIDGKPRKERVMGMDAFTSRSNFLKFTLSAGSCNIGLTDPQIGAIADIMRLRTENSGQQVYTVRREGIDVITTPSGDLDVIWADQFGVSSNLGINYRLTGSMTEDINYRTDLRQAPELLDTPETRAFFKRFFNINKVEVVGRMFGWYSSNFLSQHIRHIFGKYPMMQVYGPAGSGKSETNRLMAYMHYYKNVPLVSSALDTTRFVYEELSTSSGSIPFILDEFKPREMRKDLFEKAKGIMRSNYNGDSIGKGSISSASGQSKLNLTRVSNRAPLVVIGEACFTQSAIVERSVLVPINKEGKQGHRDDFMYCQQHREILSMLGRTMVDKVRATTFKGLRMEMEMNHAKVRTMLGSKADDNDRPLFNLATILTGLEFNRRVFRSIFGDYFEEDFIKMQNSITISSESLTPQATSEAAKVLDAIAFLTRFEEDPRFCIQEGNDYVVVGGTIEMRLKNVYTKYTRFKRSTGEEVLYDTYEAFYSAMTGYIGMVDQKCIGSALKDSAQTAVFSFSREIMAGEGIEDFKTR